MKKLLLLLGMISSTLVFATETIVVGASPIPQAEMLEFVKPTLLKQGYNLKVIQLSDYITPNLALSQKELDANFFQHQPYLDQYNKDRGTHIVSIARIHLEPMGIYASQNTEAKFVQSKKAIDVKLSSRIGVPNDPTNEGRALNVLSANGIITVKSGVEFPTVKDIVSNPKKVQIHELDPAMLPRLLKAQQLDLAVINSNFALASGLNPMRDAIILERNDSPFANIIAVRPDEVQTSKVKALVKAMTSPAMRDYIKQKYHGAIIPVF